MFPKKAKIGDICEIETPAGLAYVQYTHDNVDMGQLVRVLPGRFTARPSDFAELARQRELYFAFYTLNYALRGHQAEVVSHQPVPEWAQPYPLMRWAGGGYDQSGIKAWKIFKASDSLTLEMHQRTPFIRTLTPDQEKLSIRQLWPHPVLIRQLARGWTPEKAEELRLRDMAEAAERKEKQASASVASEETMRHFLYFPNKANAESAGKRLRANGYSVEVRMGADGENWLALAKRAAPTTGEQMDELRAEMEALAAQYGGEYDGWEAAIDSLGCEGMGKGN